ncbi:MAG: 3-deoxy-7-phosphoheptulonate synthase [Myxococcota bacterium]
MSELLTGATTTVAQGGEPRLGMRGARTGTTVVDVSGVPFGGTGFVVVAGPCAIESPSQLEAVAHAVAGQGANMLRGGVYKPRTSPYAFQGLGDPAALMLRDAGRRHRMPVVAEVMECAQVAMLAEHTDLLQVGARNMQNFSLLKELGMVRRPVLLKRGFANTVQEWLLAAEYVLAGGNPNVILCERGIRTFESETRFTLDLASVAVVKRRSHLPVIVDPSHATGDRDLVVPMALAAAAAGADGLLVEVHTDPDHALCDGPQALTPPMFADLMTRLRAVVAACGRSVVPTMSRTVLEHA